MKRLYKCPVSCKDVFSSEQKLNDHVCQKHPRFHFKCHRYTADFQTYNACFKHEQGHGDLPYQCSVCKKTFLYKKQLEEYERVHSRKQMYPCAVHYCDHLFTTKGALNTHMVTHQDKGFTCTDCGKTFSTQPYINQHHHGKHLGGWVALCCKHYEWPAPMHKHENLCKKCCKFAHKEAKKLTDIHAKIILKRQGHKK